MAINFSLRNKTFFLYIERLAEIEAKLAEIIQQISVIELDGETLRLVLFLKDGTNLSVTQQKEGEKLQW